MYLYLKVDLIASSHGLIYRAHRSLRGAVAAMFEDVSKACPQLQPRDVAEGIQQVLDDYAAYERQGGYERELSACDSLHFGVRGPREYDGTSANYYEHKHVYADVGRHSETYGKHDTDILASNYYVIEVPGAAAAVERLTEAVSKARPEVASKSLERLYRPGGPMRARRMRQQFQRGEMEQSADQTSYRNCLQLSRQDLNKLAADAGFPVSSKWTKSELCSRLVSSGYRFEALE